MNKWSLCFSAFSVSIGNILVWMCEVYLVCILKCNSVYEDVEGFIPFQNVHLGYVCIDQFSTVMLRAVIWHHQDNSSEHYVGNTRVI
jgi:hypothetical protein